MGNKLSCARDSISLSWQAATSPPEVFVLLLAWLQVFACFVLLGQLGPGFPYFTAWLIGAGLTPLLYCLAGSDLGEEGLQCTFPGLVLLAAWLNHTPLLGLLIVPWLLYLEQGRALGVLLSVPLFPALALLAGLQSLARGERDWLKRRRAVWAGLVALVTLGRRARRRA